MTYSRQARVFFVVWNKLDNNKILLSFFSKLWIVSENISLQCWFKKYKKLASYNGNQPSWPSLGLECSGWFKPSISVTSQTPSVGWGPVSLFYDKTSVLAMPDTFQITCKHFSFQAQLFQELQAVMPLYQPWLNGSRYFNMSYLKIQPFE